MGQPTGNNMGAFRGALQNAQGRAAPQQAQPIAQGKGGRGQKGNRPEPAGQGGIAGAVGNFLNQAKQQQAGADPRSMPPTNTGPMLQPKGQGSGFTPGATTQPVQPQIRQPIQGSIKPQVPAVDPRAMPPQATTSPVQQTVISDPARPALTGIQQQAAMQKPTTPVDPRSFPGATTSPVKPQVRPQTPPQQRRGPGGGRRGGFGGRNSGMAQSLRGRGGR
jgi:hypothetical protein